MRLSINIDHIATLRNARGGNVPDPVEGARICERAGVDGIVCHLREDRRHIRDNDVRRLRDSLLTKLDLEMAATPEIIAIALRIKPDLVTLVPEKRQELTTEGGLDVVRFRSKLRKSIELFHERDILVSLFVDPAKSQIDAAKEISSDMIELHTGEYADATTAVSRKKSFQQIKNAAAYGRKLGLTVNAGHGLDYKNIGPITKLTDIAEVSIGHAIIVRAAWVGLDQAVREMLQLVKGKAR